MGSKTFTIGITLAGDYNPTVTYKKLARVRDPQTGCSYLSKVANNQGNALVNEAYWQKDVDPRVVEVAQAQATAIINPNCLNRWPSPVSALNITLGGGSNGVADEYMLEFTVSGDGFAFNCNGLRWAGGEPDFEDGYTYQVSILNGLAVAAGWEAAEES